MERVGKVMLDTETCSAILRRSDAAVMERLKQTRVGDACISAVTLAELMYGVEASRRRAQEMAALDVFLRHVTVEDFPARAAADYGVVRMVLEICGTDLDRGTMLAAAHARCLGMTLVSAREAGRVQGLVVESWRGFRSGR